MIGYGRHDISEDDIAAVNSVLRSKSLTGGPTIQSFEKSFADLVEAKHAVAVSSGTAALHLASLALGIGKGDAVIVPAITFVATANAVLYCGATPIFADVDPINGNLCPASVERCIKIAQARGLVPKAIYIVHYAGRPAYSLKLQDLARAARLFILEDACHAVGASYRSSSDTRFQSVGTQADVAVWSFHPVKHITTGEGGMITTHNAALADHVRKLRDHGMARQAHAFENKELAMDAKTGLPNPWYYEMQHLGYNYRISEISAALGASQCQRVAAFLSRRRHIANIYNQSLKGLAHLSIAANHDDELTRHSYHLYPILIDFEGVGTSRASLMARLAQRGIGTQVHYIPIPFHPFYQRNKHLYASDELQGATKFYAQQLSIPIYPSLSDQQVGMVAEAIKAELSEMEVTKR